MIIFDIYPETDPDNPVRYQIPESVEEITLEQWVEFQKTVEDRKHPILKDLDNASEEEVNKILEEYPNLGLWQMEYRVKVVAFFAGIDLDTAGQIRTTDLMEIYVRFARSLSEYVPIDAPTFDFAGTTWHLPKKFMRGSRAIDFIEAAQWEHHYEQLKKGRFEALPKVIAIICRKEGEHLPLDETEKDEFVLSREKIFLKLPFARAMDAGFFLLKQSVSSMKRSQISAEKGVTWWREIFQKGFGGNMAGMELLTNLQAAADSIEAE